MKKKRYWTIFKVWFYHPIRTFIMGMEMGLLLLLITPDIAGNPDYMEHLCRGISMNHVIRKKVRPGCKETRRNQKNAENLHMIFSVEVNHR